MTSPTLHLASSSPRRVAILQRMGLAFTSRGVDVDETPLSGESAEAMVLRLAEKKAKAEAEEQERLEQKANKEAEELEKQEKIAQQKSEEELKKKQEYAQKAKI